MFVGTDACGQHFRDRRVGNRREAPVDAARRIGIPLVSDLTQGHNKGIRPVLVVNQVSSEVARLNAAKGHGNATRKAYGKDSLIDVRAEGDKPRGPADLHARLRELFRKPLPAIFGAHEDIEILLLQLQGDLCRRLCIRRCAHDGCKPRGGPIHKLDAPLSEDKVAGRTKPDGLVSRGPLPWRNSRDFRGTALLRTAPPQRTWPCRRPASGPGTADAFSPARAEGSACGTG